MSFFKNTGESHTLFDMADMMLKSLQTSYNTIITMLSRHLSKEDTADGYIIDHDESDKVSPCLQKLALCHFVYIVYGLVVGIFTQNYCQYACIKFAAFAANVSLSDGSLFSSPATIVVDVVMVFTCYFVVCTIAGFFYFFAVKFMFKDYHEEEYLEGLQIGYAYNLLLLVFTGVVCQIIPINFFIGFVK